MTATVVTTALPDPVNAVTLTAELQADPALSGAAVDLSRTAAGRLRVEVVHDDPPSAAEVDAAVQAVVAAHTGTLTPAQQQEISDRAAAEPPPAVVVRARQVLAGTHRLVEPWPDETMTAAQFRTAVMVVLERMAEILARVVLHLWRDRG